MAKSIWPESDQTQKLLGSAKQGNEEAVNRLLEKHRDPVRRMVQMRLDRKIQQRVDVSDVVQEVMVEASGRLQDYLQNPAMAFHLWLRQIAWDHMIDAYRRHRVSAKRNMDREQAMAAPAGADESAVELAAQLCDPNMTPQAIASQKEIARQVEAAIAQLGDQDREIVMMRHYEHLSNLEIAEALQLKPPAASMRYLRAVRRLRQLLEAQSSDAPDGRNKS